MAEAFFRVRLSVDSGMGGQASLKLPEHFEELKHQFAIVKEGCEECVIRVNASETDLKNIERKGNCQRLTKEQLKLLISKFYPRPKLKIKYRVKTSSEEIDSAMPSGDVYVLDEQGHRITDTYQTVRSGFYLVDVPILSELSQ
jgi:hypothetical protein